MARKKASLNLPKRRKSQPQKEIVDTEVYEVDEIIGHKLVGDTIFYEIKWKGYSAEHDTWEPEYRLTCDKILLNFVLPKLDDNYIQSLANNLKKIDTIQSKYTNVLKLISPLASLGQNMIHSSSAKFVDTDTVGSKVLLLKYLRDHDQTYVLHSARGPPPDNDHHFKRYLYELRRMKAIFLEYPAVEIIIPADLENVYYAPPPLCNLLLQPVTEGMFEKRSNLKEVFVPKSKDLGFNSIQPFIDPSYLKKKQLEEDPAYFRLAEPCEKKRRLAGMIRECNKNHVRFYTNLKLVQEQTRGWMLQAAYDIDEDTPLVIMSGVIRPSVAAHNSLVTEGEHAAFGSFIEIPGTGTCLDRRQFYDFSKFIPHSCNPTCSVRLVKNEAKFPDLVVYARVPINATNFFSISLDYYKGFDRDVKRFFYRNSHADGKIFCLYEKNIGFVHCQCLSLKCRDVLYIDRSLLRKEKTVKKTQKLSQLDPEFQFHGMQLAESDRIWEIKNGKFVEE
ncbi:unnamed protein product [Caenorhabditis sp. 36 PRJEB53466]|nr:unnamed protein product [Caenorhabditis sp. 36 PRJEB53466]